MDQGWGPLTSVLAAALGWAGHCAFGDVHRPTCVAPEVGSHAAWEEEPDAAECTCPVCPVCTCDEELRQLLSQQAALEWWRLAAAVLGVIAVLAVVLLALIGLCWAGACGWCCRRRPAAPPEGPRAAEAVAAGPAPVLRPRTKPTPELLAILAAQEVRR